MSERLVARLDPASLADRGRSVSGFVEIAEFRRLAAMLESTEGRIEVDLHFAIDDQRRRVVSGSLRGQVRLTCQRCLEPFALSIDQPVDLVMVATGEEADLLPDEIDAVVIGDRHGMHTVDLIEDELILALPLIARCDRGTACVTAVELLAAEELDEIAARQQPFAGLDRDLGGDPDDGGNR